MRKKSVLALFALASLPLLALVASACGGDDDDSATATSSASGEITAVIFLDNAGLHDIDEAINDTKEVPANARTSVLKAAAVLRNTDWPADHEADAESLAKTMVELAEALQAEPVDMAKAGELAAKVHDDAHDFTSAIWNELYEAADLPVAGGHG